MDFLKTIRFSKPKVRCVHGVKIMKMPVGRYLDVMETMGGLVSELLTAAFPGQTFRQVLDGVPKMSNAQLKELGVRLMAILPQKALELTAGIIGAPVTVLRDELSPTELLDVWMAFWEVNDLSGFFTNVRSAIPKALRRVRTTTDFKGSSPAGSPSASASAS